MQLMDDHLLQLVDECKITHETAISRCSDPTKFPTLEELRAEMVDFHEFRTLDAKEKWKTMASRRCFEYDKKSKSATIHRNLIPFVFYVPQGQCPVNDIYACLEELLADAAGK